MRLLQFLLFLSIFVFSNVVDSAQINGVIPSILNSYTGNVMQLPQHHKLQFKIFGVDLKAVKAIAFAHDSKGQSATCNTSTRQVMVTPTETSISFDFKFENSGVHFICWDEGLGFIYAESTDLPSLMVTGHLMPVWLQAIIVVILFLLSGLFSGLNLGLMALGKNELKILKEAGTETEKRYAEAIEPIRKRGNLLLCTLLLGNVLVNTTLTVLLDELIGSGILAVIFSTIGITAFGEILPQAICSRHGLAVGAKTIYITKLFIILTFPLSFPISFLLDRILGEEIGATYNRTKLRELVIQQQGLGAVAKDEVNIITGALALTTKTVESAMTPLDKAFMLQENVLLDFPTMTEIVLHGYTRIPVYGESRQDIRAILNVKDLAFVHSSDAMPLSSICDYYDRPIVIVTENTNLNTMLQEFCQGKAHMAFVEHINTYPDSDPYRELIGLITLEDVIEEIIQAEITDETDVLPESGPASNRALRKRDFRVFSKSARVTCSHVQPQLKIASLLHLASKTRTFSEELVELPVLQSLLNSNDVFIEVFDPKDTESATLFETGNLSRYFILIIRGTAEVRVSAEDLKFEAGPFSAFGESVLIRVSEAYERIVRSEPDEISQLLTSVGYFQPDYTVQATSRIIYLRITAEQYLVARHLSQLIKKLKEQKSDEMEQQLRSSLHTMVNDRWINTNAFDEAMRMHKEKPLNLSAAIPLLLPHAIEPQVSNSADTSKGVPRFRRNQQDALPGANELVSLTSKKPSEPAEIV